MRVSHETVAACCRHANTNTRTRPGNQRSARARIIENNRVLARAIGELSANRPYVSVPMQHHSRSLSGLRWQNGGCIRHAELYTAVCLCVCVCPFEPQMTNVNTYTHMPVMWRPHAQRSAAIARMMLCMFYDRRVYGWRRRACVHSPGLITVYDETCNGTHVSTQSLCTLQMIDL